MTTEWDENKHRRDGEGKFASKGPAAEAEGIDLGDRVDARTEDRDVAMIRMGSLIAKHHPDAETVLVRPSGYAYEDRAGEEKHLSRSCSAAIDAVAGGLDRTDPEVWDYYSEDYSPQASGFEYSASMEIDDSGRMTGARLPVMYLMTGRNEDSDQAPIEGCSNCAGAGCTNCGDSGVRAGWDPDRRTLPDQIPLHARPSREFRQEWAGQVEIEVVRHEGPSAGKNPILAGHDRGYSMKVDGAERAEELRQVLPYHVQRYDNLVESGSRTVSDQLTLEINPRGYQLYVRGN